MVLFRSRFSGSEGVWAFCVLLTAWLSLPVVSANDLIMRTDLLLDGESVFRVTFPSRHLSVLGNSGAIGEEGIDALADVYRDSSLGCTLNATYTLPIGWALLLETGNCTFDAKALLAQSLDAQFLLLLSSGSESVDLSSLPSLQESVDFPVVVVDLEGSDVFREEMLARYLADPESALIRVRIAHYETPSALWEFSLFVITVLLGLSFTASIVMHMHLYRVRRRRMEAQRHMADLESQNRRTLRPEDLEKYTVYTFKKHSASKESPDDIDGDGTHSRPLSDGSADKITTVDDPSSEGDTPSNDTEGQTEIEDADVTDPTSDWNCCAICLDDYQEGDQIRQLPCGHHFHIACIDQWITEKNASCPLCKYDLLPPQNTSQVTLETFDMPERRTMFDVLERAASMFSGSRSGSRVNLLPVESPSRAVQVDDRSGSDSRTATTADLLVQAPAEEVEMQPRRSSTHSANSSPSFVQTCASSIRSTYEDASEELSSSHRPTQ